MSCSGSSVEGIYISGWEKKKLLPPTIMFLNMSNLPSFCQDVDCNLSADLLQLTDSGICIWILGLGESEQVLTSVILTNYPEEFRRILYDFIFPDTGEQIMGRPSRPARFRKVWTLWLCNNCLAWFNTPHFLPQLSDQAVAGNCRSFLTSRTKSLHLISLGRLWNRVYSLPTWFLPYGIN